MPIVALYRSRDAVTYGSGLVDAVPLGVAALKSFFVIDTVFWCNNAERLLSPSVMLMFVFWL